MMRSFLSRPWLYAVLALVVLGGLWLWRNPAQEDSPYRQLVFATDWKAQAEHGGFYQAIAKGFYKERGLQVRLRPGAPNASVPHLLGAGEVDFALGSNSFIPLNMLQAEIPAKVVMAPFQSDPQVLITHPRPDVRHLRDMRGKPILLADGALATFWLWLKSKYGFRDTQIRKYSFNLAPFLQNKDAVQEGYLSSEPYSIEKATGIAPQVFLLADYGYPSYGGMLMAQNHLIENEPAIVQAFIDATAKGWADYLHNDPRPANALILADNPEMTQDIIDQAIAKLKTYNIVENERTAQYGIGTIDPARWEEFFRIMSAQGLYPADLNWRDAFTTQFVNKASAP